MLQKRPGNVFDLIGGTSQFNKDLMKNIMEKLLSDISLKLVFNILKHFLKFIQIYQIFSERMKLILLSHI